MNSTPILRGKHAVIFGAGGSIGAAVAKELRQKAQKSSCLAVRRQALKQWQSKSRQRAARRMPLQLTRSMTLSSTVY